MTVCPLTSTEVTAPLLRVRIPAGDISGLDADCHVMIDKLTTVRRSNATQRIGRLSTSQLIEVERLMMVFLGLAD